MSSTYFTNARHDVVEMLPQRRFRRVLEIGGGDFPTLLSVTQTNDAEAWGVDVRATTATLDHFVQGSITDPAVEGELPNDGFDLILANDVIEHVVDTEAFLTVLRRKLAPDGIVALSVPNARQVRLAYSLLVKGRFPRTDAGLFDRTHLRWFCRRDVEEMVDRAGLRKIDHRTKGRLVPRFAQKLPGADLVGLHNIFILTK
jgi:SAM-dependent methyltransferase